MDRMEEICFKMISNVGMARSLYIESIQLAKEGMFNEAYEKIEKGKNLFLEGHKAHAQLIHDEANGIETNVGILLIHAEDQLMSAETFLIMAEEFIEVYKSR